MVNGAVIKKEDPPGNYRNMVNGVVNNKGRDNHDDDGEVFCEAGENDFITSVIDRASVIVTIAANNNDKGGDVLVTSREEDDDQGDALVTSRKDQDDALVTFREEDDDQDGTLVASSKDLHEDVLSYASDNTNNKDGALVTSEEEKINNKRIPVPTIVAGENDSVIDRATVVGTAVGNKEQQPISNHHFPATISDRRDSSRKTKTKTKTTTTTTTSSTMSLGIDLEAFGFDIEVGVFDQEEEEEICFYHDKNWIMELELQGKKKIIENNNNTNNDIKDYNNNEDNIIEFEEEKKEEEEESWNSAPVNYSKIMIDERNYSVRKEEHSRRFNSNKHSNMVNKKNSNDTITNNSNSSNSKREYEEDTFILNLILSYLP